MKKRIFYIIALFMILTSVSCRRQTRLTNTEMNSINRNVVDVIMSCKPEYETVACTLVDSIANENLKTEDYFSTAGIRYNGSSYNSAKLPDLIYARAFIEKNKEGEEKFKIKVKATENIIKRGYFEINILNENNAVVYTFYDRDFSLESPSDNYTAEFSLPEINMNGMKISFGKAYIITPTDDEITLNKKLDGNIVLK